MLLKAGTYTFNDEIDITFFPLIENIEESTVYDLPFTITVSNYGVAQFTGIALGRGVNNENDEDIAIISYFGDEDIIAYVYGYEQGKTLKGWLGEDYGIPNEELQTTTITEDTEVDDTFGEWYIANTDYNTVNSTPKKLTRLYIGATAYSSNGKRFRKLQTGKPKNETLTKLDTTLPVGLSSMGCGVVGTDVYLLGGGYTAYSSQYSTNKIYEYDTTTNTIKTLSTTLPVFLSSMGCGVVGTDIYLFGGSYNGSIRNGIYKYDTTTDTTTTLSATLPLELAHIGCGVVGTDIYLFGGWHNGYNKLSNAIYKFDTKKGSIETLSATLPVSLCNTVCGVVGTDIYLFGGYHDGSDCDEIYKYDTTTDVITMVATLPLPLKSMGCGVVDTDIYLFGGNSGKTSSTIYKYNTTTNTITVIYTTLPLALESMGCGVVGTDIYLFGGYYYSSQSIICKFET